jgi:hypothetical protein
MRADLTLRVHPRTPNAFLLAPTSDTGADFIDAYNIHEPETLGDAIILEPHRVPEVQDSARRAGLVCLWGTP